MQCGGVILDHGWLRLYGGGCPERGLPSLAEANGLDGSELGALPNFAVAHDVLGGLYELSGPHSDRPGEPGEIC